MSYYTINLAVAAVSHDNARYINAGIQEGGSEGRKQGGSWNGPQFLC